MKLYIVTKKETHTSLYSKRVEFDSIQTSFNLEKLKTKVQMYLKDLNKEFKINLEKLTATYESDTETTTIEMIIKSIDL